MTSLSVNLPEDLLRTSQEVARKLGVSQAELIRRGLRRELEHIQADWERQAMAQSFLAMKQDQAYRQEADALDRELDEPIGEEKEQWWKG